MATELPISDVGVVNGLLKQRYSKRMGSLLNKKTPILKEFENSREDCGGASVKVSVEVRRGGGTLAIPAGGTLATAAVAVDKQCEFFPKTLTTTEAFSAEILAASKKSEDSFLAGLENRLKRMTDNLRDDVNRQMFGFYVSGKGTGVLATVPTGGTGVTSLVLSDVSRIRVGMTLAFGTATATVFTAGAFTTVTGITPSTNTIACTSCSPTTGDLVVKGESGTNGYNNELLGIDYICQNVDDNYATLDTGDYPEWAAQVSSNSGVARDLSLELMQGIIDDCANTTGTEPDFIVTHTKQRAKYLSLLLPDVRYQAQRIEGGFVKLTFAGGNQPIEITTDQWAPQSVVYFLRKDSINWFVREDFKFADSDGAILRPLGRSLSREATYHSMRELGCVNRAANGAIRDLSVS